MSHVNLVFRVTMLLALFVTASALARADGVVPWLDVQLPKPPPPRLARACRAVDLSASVSVQGATGSLAGGITVRNVARTPCSLLGWPSIAPTGPAASTTRWRVKHLPLHGTADPLAVPQDSLRALALGKRAGVFLVWSNWCGPGSDPTGPVIGAQPTGLRIGVGGGTSLVIKTTFAPRCDATTTASTIAISPWQPADPVPSPRTQLSLAATIVSPRPSRVAKRILAIPVHRGSTLHYEVQLTNIGHQPFRFGRGGCPAYEESVRRTVAYVLNCRPVTSIAPGRHVVFAMQLYVSARAPLGTTLLEWELAPRTFEPAHADVVVAIER